MAYAIKREKKYDWLEKKKLERSESEKSSEDVKIASEFGVNDNQSLFNAD